MSVKILFFGATAALAGRREDALDGCERHVSELFDQLLVKYPALRGRKLQVALNQQYSSGDEIIHDGDEIAVFTAVSGG